MYEGVYAYPDGDSTVARYALAARQYGYDGIVVLNEAGQTPDADFEAIAEQYDIDVVDGVEIRVEDPERASGFLGNYRTDHTVVSVTGGSVAMNRFAVEQPKVDVLARPMAGEGDCNHVMANAAADNGVHVEVALGPVLRSSGGSRVQHLQSLGKLIELLQAADAPYVVSTGPSSHRELRSTRDLAAVGAALDVDPDWLRTGLSEWERIAERNRDRQSESFIEPGVRRGRYETDN